MKEFTIRQAAEILKVHKDTVRRQIRSGEIKAELKIAEQLRSAIYFISKSELEKIKVRPAHRPRKTA
jgi:transposase